VIRKLRNDQKQAVKACLKVDIGQVVAPTGWGKTVVALDVSKEMAKQYIKKDKPFIVVSFVHRILLAKQWIKKANSILINQQKLAFNFINVNSGGLSRVIKDDIERSIYRLTGAGVIPILSTVNPRDVSRQVQSLLDKNFNIFLTCTYHSARTLVAAHLPVALAIHDECQTLPSNPEFRKCLELTADKKLFFTATPYLTASDDGYGQNNEDIYGPIVFNMKPVKAIKIGAIVGPQIHIVGTQWERGQTNDGELGNRDFNTLAELVFFSHARHKEVVLEQSANRTKIGAKLLVVCNGQMELQGIFNSRRFRQLRRDNPNIRIFGLCSEFGIFLNGRHLNPPVSTKNKEDFLYTLYQMGVEDDAIIFHVDMIAEGLDVPSITGMMPLRNFSSQMKFLQNVGRSTRLHPEDLLRIEQGKLKPGSWSKYIKPYCHIVLPSCVRDHNDFVIRYAVILDELRRYYDFDPSQVINVDILNPAQEGPDFDEDQLIRDIRGTLRNDINEFYYSQEQDHLDLQEALMVHRFRRFVTDDNPTEMIKLMGRY